MSLYLSRGILAKCSSPLQKLLGANYKLNQLTQPNRCIFGAKPAVHSKSPGTTRLSRTQLLGVGGGLFVGYVAFAYYSEVKERDSGNGELNAYEYQNAVFIDKIPSEVKITRKIVNRNDESGLDLVLFQYQTCPFCCKVRAYLDAAGFSYSVVEVNAVLRQSIKWSKYKKVPMLLARCKDGKYVQLTDSAMIVSALSSIKLDPTLDMAQLIQSYPTVLFEDDDKKMKQDVMNKYDVMYKNRTQDKLSDQNIELERKWRKWTDSYFIHLISPNVYRSMNESLETFRWFSTAGEWDVHFPQWERNLMVYAGATAMYFIAKRLKKRHNISDDAREDIYQACNKWTNELEKRKVKFNGGAEPNLADLAFFGALNSMEGCQAFEDILKNTQIGAWFEAVRAYVNFNKGAVISQAN